MSYKYDNYDNTKHDDFFKKRRQTLHEIPNPEAKYAKGVFQIQFPIYIVKCSNHVSITKDRVNERKNYLESTFEPS